MSWIDIEKVKLDIKFMNEISSIELIDKGYSGDIKYIFTKEDKKYLIRFNKMNQLDREMPNLKKSEKLSLVVDYMNTAFENKVRCPKVYDYGNLPQYNITYIISTFLEGEVAEVALRHMNLKEQYEAGFELGKDLYRLHQSNFTIPKVDDWINQNLGPYKNKITYYNKIRDQVKVKLNEKIEKGLINYISKYDYLLVEREIKLIHNDVHTGNIIIYNGKYSGLIDFNELKYGDPVFDHKYLRVNDLINFPTFCKGIVDGYFYYKIPELFWNVTYLYVVLAIMTYLPMPNVFTEDEMASAVKFDEKIYELYSQFEEIIPKWYKES